MNDVNWDDLRFVLALFRAGSTSGAARDLGVDQATVRRRVKGFEEWLGRQIFVQRGGRATLTPEGQRVVERAEEIDATLDPVRRQAAGLGSELEAAVRVTAVPAIVMHALVPEAGRLIERHPGLGVEFIAASGSLSIGRREADIAIRLARPNSDPDALTRKLGVLRYGVYCRAERLVDAPRLPWVGHDEGRMNIPQAGWIAREARAEGAPIPILTNDAEVSLAAVLAGHGKTLLAEPVAARLPELARVEAHDVDLGREVWLLTHPSYRERPRVRTVMNWVVRTVEQFLDSGD